MRERESACDECTSRVCQSIMEVEYYNVAINYFNKTLSVMYQSVGLPMTSNQSHSVTLAYGENWFLTHLAALLWVISILSIFCFVWEVGGQTEEAYSTWGRTNVLQASSFIFSLLVLTFRFTKPSVLFAFAVIELM